MSDNNNNINNINNSNRSRIRSRKFIIGDVSDRSGDILTIDNVQVLIKSNS